MNGPYKIPNLENQGKVVGSTNQPYFYQITIFVESLNFVFKIYEISQKHQAIRKRETILAIMKMLENVDLTDPKTLVNFALKFSHYNPSFTLY